MNSQCVTRVMVFASLALAALALPARAQVGLEPIRIFFPFAAGGSGDTLARLLAEHLRVALTVPVIVETAPELRVA